MEFRGAVAMPREFCADAAQWDVGAAAKSIRAPIETVHGDADRTVPLDHARAFPGTLHVLPGVGHRFLEPGAMERVAALAADFFRRNLP